MYIAILLGIIAGTLTGLTPGIHTNLLAVMLLGLSFPVSSLVLSIFVISMALTHTFVDAIPSIFLGAPDEDMAMGVLPGHKMLMKGEGINAVKLTLIGSLFSLVIGTALVFPLTKIFPVIYEFIRPYIGWILVSIIFLLVLKEKGINKKLLALFLVSISGFLGILVLQKLNLEQPLLPMLSGMFGVSTIILSLQRKDSFPKTKDKELKLEKKESIIAIIKAIFSGGLVSIFPGMGSAQAAALTHTTNDKSYLITVGGINTTNMLMSLVTFFSMNKARNGAIIAVQKIMKKITVNDLGILLASSLVVGGIATIITLYLAKTFSKIMPRINYKIVSYVVIGIILLVVIWFTRGLGLLILITSTGIGMLAPLLGVGRNHCMASIMIPVILWLI